MTRKINLLREGDIVKTRGMHFRYIVHSIEFHQTRFYALSEDGTSGHWFDFYEIDEILPAAKKDEVKP